MRDNVLPAAVRERALALAAENRLPAYLYDLPALQMQARQIREALAGAGVEFLYAAKANPDPQLLRVLAPLTDGIEVASGGELEHVMDTLPGARVAFGGPGKTDRELVSAIRRGVWRLHVESLRELNRVIALAGRRPVDVLLRANLPFGVDGAALSMSGPFGMDEESLAEAARTARDAGAAGSGVRVRGIHVHLASGLDAEQKLALDKRVLAWALWWLRDRLPGLSAPEVNLGGGMSVDYTAPGHHFDWLVYAKGLAEVTQTAGRDAVVLRVEPGRAVSVHAGYYVSDVLDLKYTRGQAYAIARGGTHHLRTPATKGHSQPVVALPGPQRTGEPVNDDALTVVGQLCTPKDQLAAGVAVRDLRIGDVLVFRMAGAYAWNISHHDFLMHPHPVFDYLSASSEQS
ncbi:alanine racemase [Kineosporia rhizophila]|uniref:alanine racemase n=1 Tax=Kineosporia TaxID=49184 RepID=UPI001E36B861|nr:MULTISPECIES: alanine racemase [Kineosporia]MCE0538486.1 alanine racemase [Kineosporia rhizophila]GLY18339.1 diaminopimelate decarboxylase [Kineosporia sp. NBRC 101677]